jgi:AcrR family transcriptional regulator
LKYLSTGFGDQACDLIKSVVFCAFAKRTPKSEDFLERLLRAAMRVFSQKGLVCSRMSDVAEEMGVSHGSLYNYVESKEALFYLLVD